MSLAVYKFRKYLFAALLVVLLCPTFVSAQLGLIKGDKLNESKANSEAFTAKAGFATADKTTLPKAIALVLNVFLGILGSIFLILIVVSGWNWFTAQGDSKKIETAKARMINAVIGLVVVVSAYAITVFVFRSVDELQIMNNS